MQNNIGEFIRNVLKNGFLIGCAFSVVPWIFGYFTGSCIGLFKKITK